MIRLTFERESMAEILADLLNVAANLSNPAQNVAETVAEPEPEPKKARGKAAKKKTETIEATAEEVKTEPAAGREGDPEAESEEKPLTLEDAKQPAYEYMEAALAKDPDNADAGRDAFKELLAAFDLERFSMLPEDKFGEMIALAKAKTAELEG